MYLILGEPETKNINELTKQEAASAMVIQR